jgi:hypothetical protein
MENQCCVHNTAQNSYIQICTRTYVHIYTMQRKMPKARVVYCSATGVTELSNLAYCERLGLWGKGLPFVSFEKFHGTVSKRGVFFLEMLAMELKRGGTYVSRGLSFAQVCIYLLMCVCIYVRFSICVMCKICFWRCLLWEARMWATVSRLHRCAYVYWCVCVCVYGLVYV